MGSGEKMAVIGVLKQSSHGAWEVYHSSAFFNLMIDIYYFVKNIHINFDLRQQFSVEDKVKQQALSGAMIEKRSKALISAFKIYIAIW